MLRMMAMSITGVLCTFAVALVIGRVYLVNIVGELSQPSTRHVTDTYFVVFGTAMTSSAGLLFAFMNTSSTYWAFGFPAAVFSVFGADLVFAAGLIFVAQVSLPHEQSLAGALFQTMTQVSLSQAPGLQCQVYRAIQIGTSFGLTITTIVFNRINARDSRQMNVKTTYSVTTPPRSGHITAYRAAQWTTFALALFCQRIIPLSLPLSFSYVISFSGALLAAIFLRGVGIIGHSGKDKTHKMNLSDSTLNRVEAVTLVS